MEISNTVVVGLGLGTVFIGLICLVLICYITGAVAKLLAKEDKPVEKELIPKLKEDSKIANKGEFVAAIAAAIAEDLGTDVKGIRIKSIKRI